MPDSDRAPGSTPALDAASAAHPAIAAGPPPAAATPIDSVDELPLVPTNDSSALVS